MANSKIVKFKDKKGNSYPYLFIDEKSGIFYAVKRVGKTVRKKPLGTEFQKARASVLDALNDITRLDYAPKSNKIIKDFYEKIVEEKKAIDIKASTLLRLKNVWDNSLEPYWAYLTVDDINQDQVTSYITWHKRKRPGVQLVNAFKYLGNIFNCMVESGDLLVANRPKLVLPKDEQKHHDRQKGRFITETELKKLVEKSDERTELMILISYCTGMRKMEICSLETTRIKFVDGRYVVKLDTGDTKTGLARSVPIPKMLNGRVAELLKSGSKYLFPMLTDKDRHVSSQVADIGWIEAKTNAEIKGRMRFHDLRHTCATNLVKADINPLIAVSMLGMSLSVFQKRYLKLTASDLIIASEAIATRLGAL